MPEGDTIFRTARTLAPRARRTDGHALRDPSCRNWRASITTRRSPAARWRRVEARGKWLLMHFSGDLILLTHMLMSGSWHIYRPGETWQRPRSHMRIVIETPGDARGRVQCPGGRVPHRRQPGAPRRLQPPRPRAALARIRSTQPPSPTSPRAPIWNSAWLCSIRSALAGLGNVFKSEVAFACGLNPFRKVAHTHTGPARGAWSRRSRKFLLANVTGRRLRPPRTTGRTDREEFLWVYGRAGQPCRRCATPIRSRKHTADGRISFWCPLCQP